MRYNICATNWCHEYSVGFSDYCDKCNGPQPFSISDADLAEAKEWVKSPKLLGTNVERILTQLIKHVEAHR